VVRDLIQYKWNSYAARAHWLSGAMYLAYTAALAVYVNDTYLRDEVRLDGLRLNPEADTNLLLL
jgi:hypothetical protein